MGSGVKLKMPSRYSDKDFHGRVPAERQRGVLEILNEPLMCN